jgi:hypothetical protein
VPHGENPLSFPTRVARACETPTKRSATRNAGRIWQQVLRSSKIVRVQPVSHVQLPPLSWQACAKPNLGWHVAATCDRSLSLDRHVIPQGDYVSPRDRQQSSTVNGMNGVQPISVAAPRLRTPQQRRPAVGASDSRTVSSAGRGRSDRSDRLTSFSSSLTSLMSSDFAARVSGLVQTLNVIAP